MIFIQIIMGVIAINSFSLSNGMFSIIARDLEIRKTDALKLTNIKTYQIMLSYLISALIISFVLNFFMFILSIIVIGATTTFWIEASSFFAIVGVLAITTIITCSFMLFVTTVVSSSNAIGIINGVLGTVLGFLCGIYMPYANLGAGSKYIGSIILQTHLTIWMKQIALKSAFSKFLIPQEVGNQMLFRFSADNIGLCGLDIPLLVMILFSSVFALVLLVFSIFLLNKKLNKQIHSKKLKIK